MILHSTTKHIEEYGFTRNDISYLTSHNVINNNPEENVAKNVKLTSPSAKLPKNSIPQKNVHPSEARQRNRSRKQKILNSLKNILQRKLMPKVSIY
jgi:hypothetical protein